MTKLSEDRPELDQKLSELDILKQSLEQTKAKEKEMYDQLLRLGAEFENYRKRSEARIGEARRYGKEDILLHLLTLNDALSQAVLVSEKTSDLESLKKGLQLVHQQMEKFLKDQGLVAIKSKGEKLDPHLHEVIAHETNNEIEEGTITEEIQRGFTMDDRVVRPARVKVSTHPKEEKQEEEK